MIVTLDHIEDVALNTRSFWFRTDSKVDYTAGQFIELTLPHDSDDRGQKRWFTLSSSPTEEYISITTKKAINQMSTFKQILFNLQPGAKVTISEPMGDFVLPLDTSIPLMFVAGGIGITPIRSIIKWLSDQKQKRDVNLLYSVHNQHELAFYDLFKQYKARLHLIFSEPTQNDQASHGLISAHTILRFAPPHSLIYVSGPEPMVESLETNLLDKGLTPDRLVLDFYPGYPTI